MRKGYGGVRTCFDVADVQLNFAEIDIAQRAIAHPSSTRWSSGGPVRKSHRLKLHEAIDYRFRAKQRREAALHIPAG